MIEINMQLTEMQADILHKSLTCYILLSQHMVKSATTDDNTDLVNLWKHRGEIATELAENVGDKVMGNWLDKFEDPN